MASTAGVSNSPIPEVLNRHNYKKWRLLVETYLLAEDLWEVVEAIREPAPNREDDDPEYKSWKRKNAKALYAIQISCGPEMFHFISETKTAKSAWEALEKLSILKGRAENFEPYIQFTEFVSKGDWDKAKECLKFNELDLHRAIRAIDPRNDFGNSAIHVAAIYGHVNIVKDLMLLMTQEDLRVKNAVGYTALHIAAWYGHLHVVEELVLLMGEDINKVGDTALHLAVGNGKVEIVKELVLFMRPEDLKIINNKGYTALHLAVDNGKVEIVKELVLFMRPEDLKIKNNKGYTALHLAVEKGNVPIVKNLAALVREVSGPDGDTALHLAVKMGAGKIVKELVLLMGVEDLAVENGEGYTAIHLAVNKGNVAIVKEFMTKEKERDFDSYIQFTNYVTEGERDNAIECLTKLDDHCDAITAVDPRNGHGDTALHIAAQAGHVQIVKELVSLLKVRQENLELKTVEDITAFGCGINLGVTEEVVMEKAKYMVEQYETMLISILEVQNTEGFTALQLAARNGHVNVVKELVPLMRKEGLEIQDVSGSTALILAVWNDGFDIVKELVPMMRQGGLELKTAEDGCNALHLAVKLGRMNIVKEVMPFMRKEALEDKDDRGYTALGIAIALLKNEEVMEIAKYMAENNEKVFGIRVPPVNWIPVVPIRNWELTRYFYRLTPLEYLLPEYGRDGAQLLFNCFTAKEHDMALDLLRRCPRLAISPTAFAVGFPIMELATKRSTFLSGTRLGFWQKFIYNRIHIEPANLNTPDTRINISKPEDDGDNQTNLLLSVSRIYKGLVRILFQLLGVHRLRKMKWTHIRSIDILRCISKMLKEGGLTSEQLDIVKKSIFKAVEHGHVDFVTYICESYPQFATLIEENRIFFQFAVECRQHEIYNLIHRLDEEDKIYLGTRATNFPENMLHLAGKLSRVSRFNHIRGAALQMQREIQWFKAVKVIVIPEMHEIRNSDGMTPHELFTKNHEKLKEEAEQSMKGTATSCTVVGALIVTIMFAAAFTVPGGNNGSTGAPMFLLKKLFVVFIISDTLSLVSSTTSVMFFLGILTSRYAEEDFLKILPMKMMIGLFALFVSIATMMIAFCSALIIMFAEEHSWAIIPSIFAAAIPVASFIWLQFPLLIEIFWSTYGPGIFDKKGKPWIKLVHF